MSVSEKQNDLLVHFADPEEDTHQTVGISVKNFKNIINFADDKEGCDHEVTVTLLPWMYSLTPEQQYLQTYNYLKGIFKGYKTSIVTELTSIHNIHYHCITKIYGLKHKNELINRFRQYTKYFGRKTIQQVRNYQEYIDYMKKSLNETYYIINHSPILKDDYKIFE